MTGEGARELVRAAAGGDEQAWNELVRRYAPLVFTVVRSYRLDPPDAADAFQTVWLRLVEHLDRLRDPAALASWLATTARHECCRVLRMGRRSQPFDPYDETPGPGPTALLVDRATPDEYLLRAERHQALREAFAGLPPRCRELLSLLLAVPPASYREVQRRMGIPVGSVGPTQWRCLRKLRESPALASLMGAGQQTKRSGGERDGVVAAGR